MPQPANLEYAEWMLQSTSCTWQERHRGYQLVVGCSLLTRRERSDGQAQLINLFSHRYPVQVNRLRQPQLEETQLTRMGLQSLGVIDAPGVIDTPMILFLVN